MALGTCALSLALACGDASAPAAGDDPPAPGPELADAPLASPCPGRDEDFAFRALRLLQGRRPLGVRELQVLAGLVRELDAAGRPGRLLVARALARGDRWLARARTFLLDELRVPRVGVTAFPDCYGRPGPAAGDARLASFLRDHGPDEPVPEDLSDWTMSDVIDSSLRLDDLGPLLRAHLLARQVRPVGGNNVAEDDLERARRVYLGRGFAAAYLGRRLECLACHHGGDGTATDHDDPARDRTWPALPGLEDILYGGAAAIDEDAAYAAFRVHGFVNGPLRPWGGSRCGGFDPGRGGDLLGAQGRLAGELPAGAHALDLEDRLRRGLDLLRAGGLDAAADPERPEAALAALVALRLADAAWREASGRPLTLPHGQPRNPIQRSVLRELAAEFVGAGLSLRALFVAVAVHPLLDLAEPAACAGALPPVLEPFLDDNHAGDGVRREDPWLALDAAAHALGWTTPRRFPLPFGWDDEDLVRALGIYLDDSEPGHRGLDLVGALAWEAALGPAEDPGWSGEPALGSDPAGDAIDRLVALAREDPAATVEELALAVQDRVIQEPGFADPEARAAAEALLGLPLAARAAELSPAELDAALRRWAGALLMTPQFTLAGLPPPAWDAPPRLTLPESTSAALCERHLSALAAEVPGLRGDCEGDAPALDD